MGFLEKVWKFGLIATMFGTAAKSEAKDIASINTDEQMDDIGMLMEQIDEVKEAKEISQFKQAEKRMKWERNQKKNKGKTYPEIVADKLSDPNYGKSRAQILNEKSRKNNQKSQYATGRVSTRSKIYGNDPVGASRMAQGKVEKGYKPVTMTKKLI